MSAIGQKRTIVAIEVKSVTVLGQLPGLGAFARSFRDCRRHVIRDGGIPIAEFLLYPAEHWL